MALVISSISMSLDGFFTGPNPRVGLSMGEDGRRLHDWLRHSTPADDEVLGEAFTACGAILMGRDSYDRSEGAQGWGRGGPVGKVPCFVVTHRAPDPGTVVAPDVFTFVTDGFVSALEQAKAAAGERWVGLHGGSVAQQAIKAGMLDELQIHLVPILLGGGTRLLEHLGVGPIELKQIRVVETPNATHLRFRVVR
ncbi:dihydrofolate reductase [Allocatelliglobosispora scoriae]|uniref:Dihydrofolate reductase n=1 Tax=Allocatelliglobosispora scoriae TaxID=643052 RepID=A0A841BLD3_9ACTN|nr:dihydrofolate reductase family protein [Allocatelliglobosispora scoriae]MBB5868009.1 dihydrofolate reductase [Allocatelliglobosispora scoriae]